MNKLLVHQTSNIPNQWSKIRNKKVVSNDFGSNLSILKPSKNKVNRQPTPPIQELIKINQNKSIPKKREHSESKSRSIKKNEDQKSVSNKRNGFVENALNQNSVQKTNYLKSNFCEKEKTDTSLQGIFKKSSNISNLAKKFGLISQPKAKNFQKNKAPLEVQLTASFNMFSVDLLKDTQHEVSETFHKLEKVFEFGAKFFNKPQTAFALKSLGMVEKLNDEFNGETHEDNMMINIIYTCLKTENGKVRSETLRQFLCLIKVLLKNEVVYLVGKKPKDSETKPSQKDPISSQETMKIFQDKLTRFESSKLDSFKKVDISEPLRFSKFRKGMSVGSLKSTDLGNRKNAETKSSLFEEEENQFSFKKMIQLHRVENLEQKSKINDFVLPKTDEFFTGGLNRNLCDEFDKCGKLETESTHQHVQSHDFKTDLNLNKIIEEDFVSNKNANDKKFFQQQNGNQNFKNDQILIEFEPKHLIIKQKDNEIGLQNHNKEIKSVRDVQKYSNNNQDDLCKKLHNDPSESFNLNMECQLQNETKISKFDPENSINKKKSLKNELEQKNEQKPNNKRSLQTSQTELENSIQQMSFENDVKKSHSHNSSSKIESTENHNMCFSDILNNLDRGKFLFSSYIKHNNKNISMMIFEKDDVLEIGRIFCKQNNIDFEKINDIFLQIEEQQKCFIKNFSIKI